MKNSPDSDGGRLCRPGDNCWRVERAEQAAVLVDAAPYYRAVDAVVRAARQQLLIVGWDLDSRVKLRRGDDQDDEAPAELRPLLNHVVRRRPELQVYLLVWDYALIYALEREWIPIYNLGLRTHRRIHFHLDDQTPPGGSHHQKIVVADDAVAFSGGIDLTRHRWDTGDHCPDDERRVDPDGTPFDPYHDVQMAVSGDAARALGELCRGRWQRATGERLDPVQGGERAGWPGLLQPDFEQVELGIARTVPALEPGGEEVREVERLFVEAIEAARRTIYIENQYLTAGAVRRALARRLAEENGPEVVIVGPRRSSGWLESSTMDVLRARALRELRQADQHGRLGAFYPTWRRRELPIYVHAKVMVVDDRLLRVGSANMANRSMGLDTECDLLLEARGDEEVARGVAAVRGRLLGEHLGLDPEEFARIEQERGSTLASVRALAGEEERQRTLVPLEVAVPEWLDRTTPEEPPFDPVRPLSPVQMFERLVPEEVKTRSRGPLLRAVLLLLALLGLAALWRWTPLLDWLDPRVLSAWAEPVLDTPLEPLLGVGLVALAALVLAPLTLLIVYSAMVFGPLAGFGYSLAGALIAAAIGFAAGRRLGRSSVRSLAGPRLNRIGRLLANGGVLGVATVRLLPVAPYSVVNVAIGATGLGLWEFIAGTALGLLPGLVGLTLLGDRVRAAVMHPDAVTLAILAGAVLLLAGLAWLVRRRLGGRGQAKARDGGDEPPQRPEGGVVPPRPPEGDPDTPESGSGAARGASRVAS